MRGQGKEREGERNSGHIPSQMLRKPIHDIHHFDILFTDPADPTIERGFELRFFQVLFQLRDEATQRTNVISLHATRPRARAALTLVKEA